MITITHGNTRFVVKYENPRIGLFGRQSVRFLKYDEAGKLIADRELLFRNDNGCIVQKFTSYEEVRRFWGYPNHAKLDVRTKTIYDIREVECVCLDSKSAQSGRFFTLIAIAIPVIFSQYG